MEVKSLFGNPWTFLLLPELASPVKIRPKRPPTGKPFNLCNLHLTNQFWQFAGAGCA
jgi:hypothetical protein